MSAGVTMKTGTTSEAANAADPMDVYRSDFERQAPGATWLNTLRSRGIQRFGELGFPSMKDEDWHFTNVSPIAGTAFSTAEPQKNRLSPSDIKPLSFGASDWDTLVFVDGRFVEDLSSVPGHRDEVKVGSLARAIQSGSGHPERHLGTIAAPDSSAFTALNSAFIRDGAFIEIPADASVSAPIHLVFVSTSNGAFATHPRNVIVAARHSRATIIESYVSIGGAGYLTNAVTEIALGEGARVDHYKIQRESIDAFHVGTLEARQQRASELHSFSFAAGAKLSRTNIYTVLDGEAASCTLNGLYLADGVQHMDHQTRIEHVQPNCPSRELYKGVLDGRSHGVFNGKVYVHPEAQKTDGKQSNNNLLLSPTARVDTKPQLEIYADDVRCTHGATVGRLDELAMFYLNSRGIGADSARTLLTYAFAADVLETIGLEPLRDGLEKMVLARFTEPATS